MIEDEYDWKKTARIVSSESATEEDLIRFHQDEDVVIRECVALNPNTPAHILEKLAKDTCYSVVANVATNPSTSPELLSKLSYHKNYGIQLNVIHNPNTSDQVLYEMKNCRTLRNVVRREALRILELRNAFSRVTGTRIDEQEKRTEQSSSQGEKVMTKSIVQDITDTYSEANIRVLQRQLIKRFRDALIKAVSSMNTDRESLNLLKKFLNTKLGEGTLSLLLGFAGTRIDMFASNATAMAVLEESKVEGMAVIGDDVIEKVVGQIAPMIMGVVSTSLESLPEIKVEVKDKPKRIRIKAPVVADDSEEEAINEVLAVSEKAAKKQKAEVT